MKKALAALFLAIVAMTISMAAQSLTQLELGKPVPMADRQMLDVSGKKISLKQAMKENGLLVVFSCNTCPYVLAWEDRYTQLGDKCADMNIGMIAVNSNEAQREDDDSYAEMVEHAKNKKYTFSYVVDEDHKLADAFGADRTPHVFLFDKKGVLVYRGAIDDNHKNAENVKYPYLMRAMDYMFAGRSIEMSSTKSIGCTIKRN